VAPPPPCNSFCFTSTEIINYIILIFYYPICIIINYGVGGVFTELLASHCKKYKPKKVNTLYKSKVVGGGGENDGGGGEGDKGGMRRLFQFKKMVMEKKDKKRKTIFFFSRKTFDKLR
jgi:hypothetical protein